MNCLRVAIASVDQMQPMTWPDKISVYHKLRSAPTPTTNSFILDVLIVSEKHRRPAARCEEDIVIYDYQKAQKTPLRDFMVEQFRETFRLQEESKGQNTKKIHNLLERVDSLEKASWNRPDAAEDMGTTK